MGRQIAVEYHVPVLCWVDIEEGEVVRVAMMNELTTPTGDLIDENGEVMERDEGAFEVATQIAENKDWPAWESDY